MQGVIQINGRVAKIRVRVQVEDLPDEATVDITDLMFQPGGVSGWIPHVTELPWAAGVAA